MRSVTQKIAMLGLFLAVLPGAGSSELMAQALTRVTGVLVDGRTREPLPFANVAFTGTSEGATTDVDGRFSIQTTLGVDSVTASYVGYESRTLVIKRGRTQDLRVELMPVALRLAEVTVSTKRERYRRRGNPAVDLIRNVIAHKRDNRLEAQPFYQYDKYEKVELDLSNVTQSLTENRLLRAVDFIFDYLDTLPGGQAVLPMYMQESQSRIYYRREPAARKEYREGLRLTNIDDYVKNASMYRLTQRLYQDIDVYQPTVFIFDGEFVSPLAPIAPTFYHYSIVDTITYNGERAVDLAFVPANQFARGFEGNLYIKADSSYQVLGLKMSMLPNANINFVQGLRIEQSFRPLDSVWVVSRDHLEVEFTVSDKLVGVYGKKTTIYSDYSFTPAEDPDVYQAPGALIEAPGQDRRDESWWAAARPEPLSAREAGIYHMMDTLRAVPLVKTGAAVARLFSSGWVRSGSLYLGSFYSLVSNNEVEGWRFRFGAKTNERFHDHLHLRGYLAYGTLDRRLKYSGTIRYGFDKDYQDFPRHYLALTAQQDNQFPGQAFQFVDADNLFLSFRPGVANKMLSFQLFQVDYHKELPGNLFINLMLNQRRQRAAGAFDFSYYEPDQDILRQVGSIITAETALRLQYAPNADMYESAHYRYPLPNRYPIIDLTYLAGWKGILGGEYDFHSVELGLTKRFYMSSFGYSDLRFNAGKVWGERLPYLLLQFPRANQSYAYQPVAFNVMNFLEFVTDEYASIHLNHFFNGFIFNKIPLLRRLKWREMIGFKALYGHLGDANNPNIDRSLIQFPAAADGSPETFLLGNTPYMEVSFGVGNIFRLLRVDYVRRLNYLDQPNLPKAFGIKGAGIRLGAELRF